MPIEIRQVLSFIREKEELIVVHTGIQPHDYQSLKLLSLQLELAEEIAILKKMAMAGDFEVSFLRHCKERASKINGTCLSFATMPEGMVNKLYWDIAMLFQPRTMGEMLGILMPDITEGVKPHYELHRDMLSTHVSMTDVRVRFTTKKLNVVADSPSLDVLNEPPSVVRLGDLVVSEHCFLDAKDITAFNFFLHRAYHAALVKFHQTLASRLYQHTPAVRRLSDQLSMLQGHGQTPLEAITSLIRELLLGGSRMTGSEFAAGDAQIAFAAFVGYLEALPVVMRSQLMSLTDGKITFESVIRHLRGGDCVEVAAGNLQKIIDIPANRLFLMTRPRLTNDYLKSIVMEYRNKFLPTKAMDSISILPTVFLVNILGRIEINNSYDYVSLLLSFPPEFYSSLLQHARIRTGLGLPFEFAARIYEGVLSSQQNQALFAALFVHYQKFSILKVMAFHMNAGGSSDDRLIFFRSLPLDVQTRALKEKNNSGSTLLHVMAPDSNLLMAMLGILPEQERLKALKQKNANGEMVFHFALKNPESIRTIFSLVPEKKRLSLLSEKNQNKNTLLDYAKSKPQSLLAILTLLPASACLKVLKRKGLYDDTLLHEIAIASNPKLLRSLLALLQEHERLPAVEERNGMGYSALSKAVSNIESFRMVFELYPEKMRREMAKSHFLLSMAASNPDCLYFLLELNPDNDRMKLLTTRERNEPSLLYRIRNQPELVVGVLDLLPQRDRLNVLKVPCSDRSLFHDIVTSKPSILDALIKLISKEALCDFVMTARKELHIDTFYPEALAKILALFDSQEARFKAVKQKSLEGVPVLHYASYKPISLRMILEVYPIEERFIAVTELINSESLIEKCGREPQSLTIIFDLLPVEKHFEAIKTKDGTGYALLRKAVYHEKSLEKIFALYPTTERFNAACHVARSAVYESTLSSLLKLLTKSEGLRLVKSQKLLHVIGSKAALLPVILSLYPVAEQLKALKERNDAGDTVLYGAIEYPETLRALLSLYPPEERFNALKEKSEGHMLLYHMSRQSFEAILPLLSPTERLQCAVMVAQIKYEEWYKEEATHRGASGFFSRVRHSAYGQARAKKIMAVITAATDEDTIIQQLLDFLRDDKTRYNQHSFVAFLLEELGRVGGRWSGLGLGGEPNVYNKINCVSVLNSRLALSLQRPAAPPAHLLAV